MTINVFFYSIASDRTGLRELSLDLRDGATVADAAEALIERFPELAGILPSCRFAIDTHFASASETLIETNRLSLLPPMQGG